MSDEHAAMAPVAVLRELRRTRTQRRLGDVEWFDIAYRVYLFGLVGLGLVVWVSDLIDGLFEDEIAADVIVGRAPSLFGVAVAVALAIGLRNGAEGGPVAIEPADVRHLLLAPLPHRAILMRPVAQRIRSAAFVLGLACGVAGQLVATELPGSRAAWAASGAVFGALTGALYASGAVLAHVWRVPRWVATAAGAVLIVWQSAAAWLTWNSEEPEALRAGPFNLVGSVGAWGIRQRGVDVLAIAIVLGLVGASIWWCGRLRSERLQFRARLVSQLRFAATVQDLRTVVLLRRQLRAERLRTTPWLGRRPASLDQRAARTSSTNVVIATVQRGITSLRRLPAPRVARIVALAATAGASAAFTVESTLVFAAPLLISLFLLGLEALEPLSQEVDRPSITDSIPLDRGHIYAAHLIAPAMLLVIAAMVGATVASIVEPGLTVAAFALAVPVAWAGAIGAVVTTVSDAPPLPQNVGVTLTGRDKNDQTAMVPPEFAGFSNTLIVVIPLVCSATAVLPIVLMRSTTSAGPVIRSFIGLGLAIAAAVLWVLWRDRVGTRIRRFFLQGRQEYAASGGRFA